MTGRSQIASHGVEGDALLVEVVSAVHTLTRLLDHASLAQAPEAAALRATAEQVEKRLERQELEVIIAGERGAGKTTFIDALLGDRRINQARGRTRTTTFIRKGERFDYRAKQSGGRIEEFAERFVDRRDELASAVADAQWAVEQAQAAHDATAVRDDEARALSERADEQLREAIATLESARARSSQLSAELAEIEGESARARTELLAIERTVPGAVRALPPWWALWLWLMRMLFMLLKRGTYQKYVQIHEHSDQSGSRLIELRARAGAEAASCADAQARVEELGASVASLRAEAASARSARTAAETELQRALAELERHRAGHTGHDEERLRRFFADLASISDASGRGKNVTEIEITSPARWLPDDVVLIDAPALTEGALEEQARAWLLISDRADGCILISELDRAVSESTKRFLQKMREVVPHVLLVLSKMDKAFVDAVRRGGTEPWAQIEHARRIGTRRFAREIGRAPEAVLSVALAAEPAIADERTGLARRFEAEVAKLFQLLRHERALILGTRAAAVVRRCIGETADAEQRAERAYHERIAALEANRLPEPETFRQKELESAEAMLDAATERVLSDSMRVASDGFSLLRAQCAGHFRRAKALPAILDAAASCERELSEGVTRVRSDSAAELEQAIDHAVREIEVGMFERLRERYQLIHDVRRSSSSLPRLETAIVPASAALRLVPDVQSKVVSFRRLRWTMGAVGVVVAAAIGTLVAPGLGTLAGAAVGPLLALVPTRSGLSRRAHAMVETALERQRQSVLEELQSRRPRLRAAIRDALDRSLGRVMVRFGRFIAEPLEAEQQAIDRERTLLAELGELRQALKAHDARLGQLTQAAAEASIGLCR